MTDTCRNCRRPIVWGPPLLGGRAAWWHTTASLGDERVCAGIDWPDGEPWPVAEPSTVQDDAPEPDVGLLLGEYVDARVRVAVGRIQAELDRTRRALQHAREGHARRSASEREKHIPDRSWRSRYEQQAGRTDVLLRRVWEAEGVAAKAVARAVNAEAAIEEQTRRQVADQVRRDCERGECPSDSHACQCHTIANRIHPEVTP